MPAAVSRIVLLSVCLLLLSESPNLAAANLMRRSDPVLSLTADPSTAVIKVGDKAMINLTLTSAGISGQACFDQQGFPASGFTLTFVPECAQVQQPVTRASLIVEATPAAAPQNFTASIVATIGNQTVSTPLTITVVPAIPPWIPWLGILLFFLVIGVALFVKPRKLKGKGKMRD